MTNDSGWIKVHVSNNDIEEIVQDFTEVLSKMGVTVECDHEGEGLSIQIRNEQWRNKDLLYVLTISGDLADYYDSTAGRKEGDFDALTPEQQQSMAHYVENALDGFMEDRYIAFDTGIDDSGL